MKTRAVNNDIMVTQLFMRVDNSPRRNPFRHAKNKFNICPREGGVIFVGKQYALCANGVSRRQSLPQCFISNMRAHIEAVLKAQNSGAKFSAFYNRPNHIFAKAPKPKAVNVGEHRKMFSYPFLKPCIGTIPFVDDPIGAALIDCDLPCFFGNFRNKLNGAGGIANHANIFTAQINAVIPAG